MSSVDLNLFAKLIFLIEFGTVFIFSVLQNAQKIKEEIEASDLIQILRQKYPNSAIAKVCIYRGYAYKQRFFIF